jgi:prepilin-type N-terminal cleavage/methylation domain-containing protein/prepilin-type processing-associated H-X9-DG protein
MSYTKRAFTLIELLVVIAIIAILAAILFPVFASAKQAAKGAASLSNVKQIALGSLMYSGDSNDMAVPHGYWDDGNTAVVYFNGVLYTPWAALLVPYMKNTDLLNDPLTTPVAIAAGWGANAWRSINSKYGYNYTTLSPVYNEVAPQWPVRPVSMTSVGRPADVVMFGGTGAGWLFYGVRTLISTGAIDAPDCNSITQYCFQNWGVGGNISSATGGNIVEGAQTGWNSLRIANQHNMAFVDGHVKRMTPSAAAAGTNFYMNMASGDLVVNNASIYRWNLQ